MGASAGGLEAMEEFFRNLPRATGIAFVVVTHQHPGHHSMLAELLSKCTEIPVNEAVDGVKLEPDHAYVCPPGALLALINGRIQIMPAGGEPVERLPIDHFFRSLAADQKERAICVVLSGTGTDGTLGLRAVKGESGMAMVQDIQSAKYAGMPSSAAATRLADFVLPPAEMPKQLIAYVSGPYLKVPKPPDRIPALPPEPMDKVFVLLRSRTGHDFSSYKSTMIRRRIERRMNVHQIEKVGDYVRYLQENPQEIDNLFQELLINVTGFFRDPAAFEALAAQLPALLAAQGGDGAVRVWVPGCCTGEEAYSIAILLRECLESLADSRELQIFATDIDAAAIEKARMGVYPDGIAVDLSRQRLDRYFVREDGTYRIRKDIREMVVFAPQDVIRDPPFTRLDLISCRNLLIYLTIEQQRKLLPMFHYVLRPGGILFLGPSETIGDFTDLFTPLDSKWKIYRRKETAGRRLVEFPAQAASVRPAAGSPTAMRPLPGAGMAATVEGLLLSRFAPASAIVDDRGDIVYIHGRVGAYLEPASGGPRLNILEMAREGLQIELAHAMREAIARNGESSREQVRVAANGGSTYIDVLVDKLAEPEALRGLLLVSFRPARGPRPAARTTPGRAKSDLKRVADLERELRNTRESLRTTVEELETSNEELKAANEELQSMNEELQSTNEELETSKEEMQSLNEELTTVNTELQSKVDELSQTNDDMQNLLDSTDIATLFLDRELKIKRFTEKVTRIVSLISSDVGRPIKDLAANLRYDRFLPDAQAVLATLGPKEDEVRTHDGRWYLMRMMPYRTADDVIDGVVVTFVDIDRTKQAELASHEKGLYFESIVDTVREPLLILDARLHVVTANRAFYRTFETTENRVAGQLIYDLGKGHWNIPDLRRLLEEIIPKNTIFDDYRVEHEFPKIGHRVMMLNARRIQAREGAAPLILLAMEDVTLQQEGSTRG